MAAPSAWSCLTLTVSCIWLVASDETSTINSTCRHPLLSLCNPSPLPTSITPVASLSPDLITGATADCLLQPDGSCKPFENILAGVLLNIKPDALHDLLNGTDVIELVRGRQAAPSSSNVTLKDIMSLLQAGKNRTTLSQQAVNEVDVTNLTHNEAKDLLTVVYDILVADNSSEQGLDDRVVDLVFKMSHVSWVDEDMLTVFGKCSAVILTGEELKIEEEFEKKQSKAVLVLETMERVLTVANATRHELQLPQLAVHVAEVEMTSSVEDFLMVSKVGDRKNVISLSGSLFPSGKGTVSTVAYSGIHGLLPSNRKGSLRNGRVASHVVSVVVDNRLDCAPQAHWCATDGTHGYRDFTVNFTLPLLSPAGAQPESSKNGDFVCIGNSNKGRCRVWSEDGCWLLDGNASHVTCTCSHLSTFAVLVTYTHAQQVPQEEEERGMFLLTAIGCSLSIAGLLITLLTYGYLRILHRERIFIHANLALSLLLAQVLFIASEQAHRNETACRIVAALLHFLFLAAFSWMLVEGVALYRTCTRALLYAADARLRYSLLGWGLPLVIVVVTLGVELPQYGRGLQSSCWLSVEKGLIWAFMAPMLSIVSLNGLVLGLVIRVFLTLRANSQKSDIARVRAGVRAMMMLVPLLGTTWLLSLLVPLSPVFGYIFIACNSLQGLLLFLLHCLSSEEVRRFLARRKSTRRPRIAESHVSVVRWRRHSPVSALYFFVFFILVLSVRSPCVT